MGELYAEDYDLVGNEEAEYEEERIAGSSQFSLTHWTDHDTESEGWDLLLRVPIRKRDLLAVLETVPESLYLVALDEDGFLYWEKR